MRRLFRRVDARPLAVARILVAVAALLKALDLVAVLAPITEPDGFRIPYAAWLPEPTPALATMLLVVWAVAAGGLLVGLYGRFSAGVLTVVIAATFLLDQQIYSNHLYLILIVSGLLAVTESDARFALRPGPPRDTLPAWQPLLMKVQVTVVYGFAALAKLNAEYLSGRVLGVYLRHLGPFELPSWLRDPDVLVALAQLSVLTEAFLAVGLWWRRTRIAAVLVGVAFHAAIVATMRNRLALTVFALTTIALYAAFFADDRPSPAEPRK